MIHELRAHLAERHRQLLAEREQSVALANALGGAIREVERLLAQLPAPQADPLTEREDNPGERDGT